MCYAPLYGKVILPCSTEDGKWLHNSTILDDVTSSNLTLSDVQYNNSGRYLHDTNKQCDYLVSVGGIECVLLKRLCILCIISS